MWSPMYRISHIVDSFWVFYWKSLHREAVYKTTLVHLPYKHHLHSI